MADDREIVVGSLITLFIMQLRGCEFITEEYKKTLRVQSTSVRKNSMENVKLSTRTCYYGSGEMCSVYANGYTIIRGMFMHG